MSSDGITTVRVMQLSRSGTTRSNPMMRRPRLTLSSLAIIALWDSRVEIGMFFSYARLVAFEQHATLTFYHSVSRLRLTVFSSLCILCPASCGMHAASGGHLKFSANNTIATKSSHLTPSVPSLSSASLLPSPSPRQFLCSISF